MSKLNDSNIQWAKFAVCVNALHWPNIKCYSALCWLTFIPAPSLKKNKKKTNAVIKYIEVSLSENVPDNTLL